MFYQINDTKQLKAIMMLIGKEKVIPAFEKHIGVPWKEAKMSKFYALGLGLNHNKGVLYYLDGTVQYGALVVEFSIDYIHKFIPKEILASNSDLP